MSNEPYYVSFFPLAGQDGTLRNFLKGTSLDDYIALKTGSMRGVQAYAGYKLDDNYMPTHVVVIIINGFGDNRTNVKKATDKFLLEVFENS
jgi:D-alanyl-D-alanine carboxypeptidase/D-alanyl-D-alanine-endopeptidase (penicillin-binding protein 4)